MAGNLDGSREGSIKVCLFFFFLQRFANNRNMIMIRM